MTQTAESISKDLVPLVTGALIAYRPDEMEEIEAVLLRAARIYLMEEEFPALSTVILLTSGQTVKVTRSNTKNQRSLQVAIHTYLDERQISLIQNKIFGFNEALLSLSREKLLSKKDFPIENKPS